jgi:glycine cleavage system aminomethyltransferase T
VGRVTDLVWSPRLERNIGYVWVPAEFADPGNDLEIEWPNGERTPAKTAAIPFLDPHKPCQPPAPSLPMQFADGRTLKP